MKGFGIYVKNDLLEPKHVEQMGPAIWLYLLFLDKMTSISEDGVGLILGGKPVIFEEVQQELGLTVRTYRRWVSILRDAGYIETITAPRGLIIYVNKAKKVWSAKSGTPAKNGTSGVPKVAQGAAKNGTRNKDKTVDSTVGHSTNVEGSDEPQGDPAINEMMSEFKAVYGYPLESRVTSQRRAAATILLRSRRRLAEKRGITDPAEIKRIPPEDVLEQGKLCIQLAFLAAKDQFSKTKPANLRDIVTDWDRLQAWARTKPEHVKTAQAKRKKTVVSA